MSSIKSYAWNDSTDVFNTIYSIPVNDVFRIRGDKYESVLVRIDRDRPVGKTFAVLPITPGTELYTLYGANTLIVTANTP